MNHFWTGFEKQARDEKSFEERHRENRYLVHHPALLGISGGLSTAIGSRLAKEPTGHAIQAGVLAGLTGAGYGAYVRRKMRQEKHARDEKSDKLKAAVGSLPAAALGGIVAPLAARDMLRSHRSLEGKRFSGRTKDKLLFGALGAGLSGGLTYRALRAAQKHRGDKPKGS